MITVNELFSGIGSQHKALGRTGIEYKVIGVSEINRDSIKAYEAIFGETHNYGDISKISRLEYADLWTYSFPRQDISAVGVQKGLGEGTRSGLLYEVGRLLEVARDEGSLPKHLMLENVKNLVSAKFMPDFQKWLGFLSGLGYDTYWQTLDSKDFGLPQHRERVFALSAPKGAKPPRPLSHRQPKCLRDIAEPVGETKKYQVGSRFQKRFEPHQTEYFIGYIRDLRFGAGSKVASLDGVSSAFLVSQSSNMLLDDRHSPPIIRVMTPLEKWRSMGFDDSDFFAAKGAGISDYSLHRLIGDSIAVNVLEELFKSAFC